MVPVHSFHLTFSDFLNGDFVSETGHLASISENCRSISLNTSEGAMGPIEEDFVSRLHTYAVTVQAARVSNAGFYCYRV